MTLDGVADNGNFAIPQPCAVAAASASLIAPVAQQPIRRPVDPRTVFSRAPPAATQGVTEFQANEMGAPAHNEAGMGDVRMDQQLQQQNTFAATTTGNPQAHHNDDGGASAQHSADPQPPGFFIPDLIRSMWFDGCLPRDEAEKVLLLLEYDESQVKDYLRR